MDIAKFNKALHGGLAAAATAVGGTGGISVTLPADLPHVGAVTYVVEAIIGFAVGFAWVYLAPANKPGVTGPTLVSSTTAPK